VRRRVSNFVTIVAVIIVVIISTSNLTNVACTLSLSSMHATSISSKETDYRLVVNSINLTNIQHHIAYLSSFPSRVTGYPGCESAAEYIQTIFESYGLKTQNQYFNVTVPIDLGSFIVLPDGRVIKAFSMWPNLIQPSRTPSEGLEGHLIYVGRGDLSDFDGKRVEGSIVLLDFDSGRNWMTAAKLGAKAAIFVETPYMSRSEAYEKMSITPINFPRLYVSAEDGEYLKALAKTKDSVKIISRVEWQLKTVRNVIGVLEGTSSPNEIVVVSAYYDAWSITPGLAPGADEAAGVATLMELARILSKNPQERSIWFVALTGHWQFLAGAREFVEEYYFNQRRKIWFMVSLDFSTDSNTLGLMYASHAYGYGGGVVLPRYTRWIAPQIWDDILPEMERQLQKKFKDTVIHNGFLETGWHTLVPIPYYLDSEALSIANGLGIGLHTTKTFRNHWHHPKSSIETVDLQKLKPQVEVSCGIVYGLVTLKQIRMDWSDIQPQRNFVRLGLGSGFLTFKGRVRIYEPSSMWYSPVTSEYGQILVHTVPAGHMYDPFKHIVVLADHNGTFTIHGMASVAAYGGHGATWSGLYNQMLLEAFILDPETGDILYAPDRGPYGGGSFPQIFIPDYHPMELFPTVFRASAVILFDVMDPRNLSPLGYLDPATRIAQGQIPWDLSIYDYNTWETFIFSSQILIPHEQTVTFFIQPGTRFIAVLKVGLENVVSGVLTNSTVDKPEGYGYLVPVDKPELRLTFTALRFATDLYHLTQSRLVMLNSFRIYDPLANLTKSQTIEKLPRAYEALEKMHYSEAYSLALSVWNWESQCYPRIRTVINDVNITTIFFFTLLIPFSIVVEKMFLNTEGKRRMIGIISIFAVMVFILYFFHPGMRISENSPVILGGFIILVLSVPILSAFSWETLSFLKDLRRRVLGSHFVKREGVTFYFMSFSVGIENLRNRRFRTILTLITLVLLTFALTSFTTIAGITFPKTVEIHGVEPSYQGILIKREYGQPGENLGEKLATHIKTMAGPKSIVAPRAWYYPPLLAEFGEAEVLGPNGTSFPVMSLLGLTPEEENVTEILGGLKKGRWFIAEDHYVCIISDMAAEVLNISVGDSVSFQGVYLQVIGIVDSLTLDSLKDLDQRLYTPLDPRYISGLTPEAAAITPTTEQYIPLTWDKILVVPYKLAIDFGAYTASIAVKIDEVEIIRKLIWDISMGMYGFDVWASYNNTLFVIRKAVGYQLGGFWILLMPTAVMTMLIVLTTMLGSIYERTKEIAIFSSLGLSPRHIALMFLTESSVYAIISGVLGYIIGVVAVHLLFALGAFPPGLHPNYAVGFVVLVVGFLMITTILSTLYPMAKVSKLVTPSLERKWKIPTKPMGTEWTIPLPFTMPKEEAIGALEYVAEYFQSQMLERGAEDFITRSVSFIPKEGRILAVVALAPYEMGVVQEVDLHIVPSGSDKYAFNIYLRRVSGVTDVWLTRTRNFVDNVRKQFLIWRTLRFEERKDYIQRAKSKMEVSE